MKYNDGIPYIISTSLTKEESTVDNSDNLPMRPNKNIPLTYDIKKVSNNLVTMIPPKQRACMFGGDGNLQHNTCLQFIRR